MITNGFYRFTKHPAYVSKLLGFWLVAVPFAAHAGLGEAIRDCALLTLLMGIYLWRARTEEAHLSARDPDYVRYALWIEEHGVFRFVGRWVPFLRYRVRRDS